MNNGEGTLNAQYEYDAWGNVTSITDGNGNAITSATHIGNLNPFRYRGYYYDSETGLYYLMSRYYDPVTHRFINADGYFQSGGDILDANMSAYCRNNPNTYIDKSGCLVCTIGFSVMGFAGLAAGGTLYFAFDDKGNCGIFLSYIDYNKSGGMGILGASGTITTSVIWDADTIDDLSNNYENIGFSIGEGPSDGLDLISLDDNLSGISVSAGAGAGFDWLHVYNTTTTKLWSNNNSTQLKSTSTSKPNVTNNICSICGRVKGYSPFECSTGLPIRKNKYP